MFFSYKTKKYIISLYYLLLKQLRRQIPVAGIREEDNDSFVLIFRFFSQYQGCMEGCSGGNTHQNPFGLTEISGSGISLLLGDGDDPVVDLGIQNFWDEACANAL